jgi:hypothetical protein
MARRLALVPILLVAGMLGIAPIGTAVSSEASGASALAPGTVRVQLKTAPTLITKSGKVRVVMWTKCSPDLYLFEIDVSVVQGETFGQVTLLRGTDELPVCDGKRHRFVVKVAPDQGTFRNGVAAIGAFVGAYSDATGDLEATDDVRVRLYRC